MPGDTIARQGGRVVGYILERLANARPYLELINALSSVLGLVTWLIAIPFLIFAWRRAKEIKISIFGIEATFQQRVEAAAAIGAATAQRASDGQSTPEIRTAEIARTVNEAMAGAKGKSVLWVDDKPANNEFERRALKALGIEVDISYDTDEALRELNRRRYDLVISDMSRPSGQQAGYILLDRLAEKKSGTPIIFYVGSSPNSRQEEAGNRGAYALTSDPQELLKRVTQALKRSGSDRAGPS
jgi:CheY-like chemotaxis protein